MTEETSSSKQATAESASDNGVAETTVSDDGAVKETSRSGGTSVEEKSGRSRRRPRITARDVKAGADAIRSRIATVVWIIAAICAAILAVGAILVALKWSNEDNNVVSWIQDSADWLAGPLSNVFEFEKDSGQPDESKNALVNWGLAAIVYLVVGKIVQRIIQP